MTKEKLISILESAKDKNGAIPMSLVRKALEQLPSAQPYTDTEIEKMQDLEQAEIDKAYELGREEALSEIVYCSECKYSDERWRNISIKWLPCMSVWMGGYWHCGSGERREE